MNSGSCLCGEVRYEISGELGAIIHCHCETCRKAHGSAFSSVAAVNDTDLQLSGQPSLSTYESSPGKVRHFCSCCGSQIYAKRDGTEHIVLRLGTLDTNPKSQEINHIWISQKASWYSIQNQLPECQEFK